MLASIGLIVFAICLAMVGTLAAMLYAVVLSFAGLPGEAVAGISAHEKKNAFRFTVGFFSIFAAQVYASLAFAAFIVLSINSLFANASGIGKWALWIAAFYVGTYPAWLLMKSFYELMKEGNEELTPAKIAASHAAAINVPVTNIGFIVFALFPFLTSWGWNWIPHF